MWRIGITHTRFSYTGGIEKYIYSMVERLLAAGHEVHYLATRWEEYDHPNLHFHHVPWIRFPHSLRVGSYDRRVNRILDREKFDLVHGFTKTTRQDVYTDGSGTLREYVAATQADQPAWRRWLYRQSPHQRSILRMERGRFQRDAIRRIIPMAQFVQDQILREYPVDPARVEVLYNGVETDLFRPENRTARGPAFRQKHGIPADAKVLLFVGNDWSRKALDVAINALPDVISKTAGDIRLAVAGHDNHPGKFKDLAQSRGVADRMLWLGPVREIRDAFAAATVFVFPTRYDVFGNVGLEALATGVPSVLSGRAGVGELLWTENVHGHDLAGSRLEDPEDARELASQIVTLLDPALYDERCRHARELAEHYSWDRHFERLLEIYEEVIREQRSETGPSKSDERSEHRT